MVLENSAFESWEENEDFLEEDELQEFKEIEIETKRSQENNKMVLNYLPRKQKLPILKTKERHEYIQNRKSTPENTSQNQIDQVSTCSKAEVTNSFASYNSEAIISSHYSLHQNTSRFPNRPLDPKPIQRMTDIQKLF